MFLFDSCINVIILQNYPWVCVIAYEIWVLGVQVRCLRRGLFGKFNRPTSLETNHGLLKIQLSLSHTINLGISYVPGSTAAEISWICSNCAWFRAAFRHV